MEVGIWPWCFVVVVPLELAEIQTGLDFGGHHDPITRRHLTAKGPDLRRPVDQCLGLFIGIALLHGLDQRLPVSQCLEVDIQPIPGDVHPPLVEELLLVFPAGTSPDQPERHGAISGEVCLTADGAVLSSSRSSFLSCRSNTERKLTTVMPRTAIQASDVQAAKHQGLAA